jgi:hypothetical protein
MHFGNGCITTGNRNKFYRKFEHEELEYFSPQQNSQSDIYLIFHMNDIKYIFTAEMITQKSNT